MFESFNKKYKIDPVVEFVIVAAIITFTVIVQTLVTSKHDTDETDEAIEPEYVDLGLPSGTLWATCNIGSSKPIQTGNYYAWGEIYPDKDEEVEEYYEHDPLFEKSDENDRLSYKWFKNDTIYNNDNEKVVRHNFIAKYCLADEENGVKDNIVVLEPDDDVATKLWGSEWRMPTREEMQELIDGCTWKWTKDYQGSRKEGNVGTSKTNGNTIFLPATYCGLGYYWTSSLDDKCSEDACILMFYNGDIYCNSFSRFREAAVRAVVNKK